MPKKKSKSKEVGNSPKRVLNNFVDRFEGERNERGEREGYGIYIWSSGEKYSGHWTANAMDGKGRMTFANGDVYTGIFQKGRIDGEGTMLNLSNGSISQGHFLDGDPVGSFKKLYHNGDLFYGAQVGYCWHFM